MSGRSLRLALALVVPAACSSGVDPDLTPESIWLRPPPPPTAGHPEGVRVRALTLNLHGGNDAPVERVLEVLRPLELDVVGLEECPAAYATAIAAGLGGLHRAGEEGNVLLSRTALTATRSVSMLSGRGFTHARTDIGGEPFSLYVVHIGWNAEGSRQARELVDAHLALDDTRRLLVVGDFNDEHLSPQATILEALLEDAFTATGHHPGQRISWPSTGFDGSEGSQLIDLHYYRRDDPAFVVRTEVINAVPVVSDHKPSFAELIYPRGDTRFAREDPLLAERREPWTRVTRAEERNLLVNPGAEEGASGWTPDNGGEIAEGERENQPPHTGARHFTGAADGFAREDQVSGWSQRVDLSAQAEAIDAGLVALDVAGFMAIGYREDVDGEVVASSPRPYDEGEVVVDLEDTDGRRLARWTSGRRDPLRYHPFAARLSVPRGTHAAVVRLWSHLKESSGPSHDAVFDDLYLAFANQDVHQAHPDAIVVDGEAAADWGTWKRQADGAPIGIMIYPPRTRSGRGHLAAGALLGNPTATGEASGEVEAGDLRFGGWARTMGARGAAQVTLDLYEEDGEAPWGTFALEPVRAAEWTRVEGLLRVPEGIARAVLRVTAEAAEDVVFVDELVVEQDEPVPDEP